MESKSETSNQSTPSAPKIDTFLSAIANEPDLLALRPWADRVLDTLADSDVKTEDTLRFESTLARVFRNRKNKLQQSAVTQEGINKPDRLLEFFTEVARISHNDDAQAWIAYAFLNEYKKEIAGLPDGSPEDDAVAAEEYFSKHFIQTFLHESANDTAAPGGSKPKDTDDSKLSELGGQRTAPLHEIDGFRVYADMRIEFRQPAPPLNNQEFKLLKLLLRTPSKAVPFANIAASIFKKSSTQTEEYKASIINRIVRSLINKLNTSGLDIKIITVNNREGVTFHTSHITKPPKAKYEISGTITKKQEKKKTNG